MTWDPRQYAVFADHRGRPFHELLTRVATTPERIVDLGCGDGPLTLDLAHRWPDAEIVGVDDSPAMLERARELDRSSRVRWVEADVAGYDPGEADLIVTNATLQWVPDHDALIRSWATRLRPAGAFAMQVPGNFDAPSHRILRELTRERLGPARAAELTREAPVLEPAQYARLLAGCGLRPDAWETTYVQVLDPEGEQDVPVLEWMKGTALRPVLAALGDDTEDFLAELGARLAQAYPRSAAGVYFPFRRIFAVGHRVEVSAGRRRGSARTGPAGPRPPTAR